MPTQYLTGKRKSNCSGRFPLHIALEQSFPLLPTHLEWTETRYNTPEDKIHRTHSHKQYPTSIKNKYWASAYMYVQYMQY